MVYVDSSGVPGRSKEELARIRKAKADARKAAEEAKKLGIHGLDQLPSPVAPESLSKPAVHVGRALTGLPVPVATSGPEGNEQEAEPVADGEAEPETGAMEPEPVAEEAGGSEPEPEPVQGNYEPEAEQGEPETDTGETEAEPGEPDPVQEESEPEPEEPESDQGEPETEPDKPDEISDEPITVEHFFGPSLGDEPDELDDSEESQNEKAEQPSIMEKLGLAEFKAKHTAVVTEAKPHTSDAGAVINLAKPVKTAEELQDEAERRLYSYENEAKLQRKASLAGYGCVRCRFTGWVVAMGEVVPCACQSKAFSERSASEPTMINPEQVIASGDTAVARGIIPPGRVNDDFDVEQARMNITAYTKVCMGQCAYGLDKYLEVLGKILVAITNNTLHSSFVLGAPKRSGKTTFVMTCLKRLVNAGKQVVPYMSLTDLAELQKDHLRVVGLRERPSASQGVPQEAGSFKWKDVLKADVLFTYLTNFESASVELSVLKNLLSERGMYGRPTIVMTENSVAQYKKNARLNYLYWNDIECFDREEITTKKLIHVSVWRKLSPYTGET